MNRLFSYRLNVLLLSATIFSIPAMAENAFYGFEDGTPGKLPAGWSFAVSSNKAKASCQVTTEKPRSGKYCVKLTTNQPVEPNVYGVLKITLPCQPMTEYQINMYVRSEEHFGASWFGGGRNWEWRNTIPDGTYDWQLLAGWYRTGQNEKTLEIVIGVEGRARAIWIDDISISRMGPSSDPTSQVLVKPWPKDKIVAALGPIRNKLPELKTQLEEIRKNGGNVDYAQVKLSIVETFIPRIERELKKPPKYLLQATIMTTELCEVVSSLVGDLAALQKDPKCVPAAWRYKTGPIATDGYAQMGNAIDPDTGKIVRRPVIFTGYGNFFTCTKVKWQEQGCNIISPEMGPNVGVSQKPDGELVANEEAINEVVAYFKEACKNDIAITLLISPHYMPNFGGGRWDTEHPGVWKVYETYLDALLPRIKDIPSLHSIIMSNEPASSMLADRSDDVEYWQKYIREKYGTIDALNKAYGRTYTDFSEVPLTPSDKLRAEYYEKKDRPWLYDRNRCNELRFAAWHRRMANLIHKIAPNVPVHTKICGGYLTGWGLPVNDGIDPEMFADFTQYIGFDEVGGLRIIYDVMSSFQKNPIVNSENHLLNPDGNFYNITQPQRFYSDLFVQAMHGQTASTAWAYEPECEPMALWDFSIRPNLMAEVGRAGLDLMRVAPQLAAIQNAPREVAIIYSPASFYYDELYHKTWRSAWDAFFDTGLRIRFLSENQIQKGDFGDTKVLILPEAQVVEPDTLNGLKKFVSKGGKIIAIGDCLKFTTPGWTPVAKKNISNLYWKHISTSTGQIIWQRVLVTLVRQAGVRPLVRIVQGDGKKAVGIHWLCGVLDGKKVVAVLNMSGRQMKLQIATPDVENVYDVIHNKTIPLPITLKSLDATVIELNAKRVDAIFESDNIFDE